MQAAEYEPPAQLLGACSIALGAFVCHQDLPLDLPEPFPIRSLSHHCHIDGPSEIPIPSLKQRAMALEWSVLFGCGGKSMRM